MPEIGQTLSHFRLVEKIGQGSMVEVYLADDTALDRKNRLKFLLICSRVIWKKRPSWSRKQIS